MTTRSLLGKERRWVRRNWRALAVVFVLAPALLAGATAAFDQTVPRDVPVAVAPADDAVTDDELAAAAGVVRSVAHPVSYGSTDAATAALSREEVYGVVTVKHGLYDAGANVTLSFAVDGAMVTYREPSRAVAAGIREQVSVFPATVTVERTVTGVERTLSEFLFASGAVVLLAGYAFVSLPYNLARERRVFDRIRVESSLAAMLGAKGVLFGALGALGVGAYAAAGAALGYRVALVEPVALAALGLTGVAAGATALSIGFLTRFSSTGRFLTVALLAGLVAFSNPVYPAGTFSALRRTVAGWMPLHHATVAVRAVALKDLPAGLVADRLVVLCGVAAASLCWLAVAVRVYERRVDGE
jgi:ABC-2 type transport system permease protein